MSRALLVGLALVILAGCEDAQWKQEQATRRLNNEAQARLGMPGITNFTERRLVKMLYELRDSEVVTYSYLIDLNGKLHFLCNSIGYGLPYAVQYTHGGMAEPNGLYMPPGAEGTWIMCANGKEPRPVYVEPRVIVSPFKLHAADSYVEGG